MKNDSHDDDTVVNLWDVLVGIVNSVICRCLSHCINNCGVTMLEVQLRVDLWEANIQLQGTVYDVV